MSSVSFAPPDWFVINRYDDLDTLDHVGWATQIGTRIALAGYLEMGALDQFDDHFSQIKVAPFYDIGFVDHYVSNRSVYSLTWSKVQALNAALDMNDLSGSSACDYELAKHGVQDFAAHIHLTADLTASKQQALKDFESQFMEAKALFRAKFADLPNRSISLAIMDSWAAHQILPYQDLSLWSRRSNSPMASDTVMAGWLFQAGAGDKNTVRETRTKAGMAFQLTTMRLLNQAEE